MRSITLSDINQSSSKCLGVKNDDEYTIAGGVEAHQSEQHCWHCYAPCHMAGDVRDGETKTEILL